MWVFFHLYGYQSLLMHLIEQNKIPFKRPLMQTLHRSYFNTTSFALHPEPRWAPSEDVFLQILLQASESQAAFGLSGQRMVTLLRVRRFWNPLSPMKLVGLRLPSLCSSWLQISRDGACRMTHPPEGQPQRIFMVIGLILSMVLSLSPKTRLMETCEPITTPRGV